MLFKNFKKVLLLLNHEERKAAFFLYLIIILTAFIDTLGIASILPFMSVLSNNDLIENNNTLNMIYENSKNFGVKNHEEFKFFLGLIVFVILVTSLAFKAFANYKQAQFVQLRTYSISRRLVKKYLHQAYSWFLNNNSSNLGKSILSEVDHVITLGVNPLIEIIAKSTVIISILTLLIITNPKVTLIASLLLSSLYIIIFYLFKGYLERLGQARLDNNKLRFISVNEAFRGIKDIKLRGIEQIYIDLYSGAASKFAKFKTIAYVISFLPRYLLEAIAFGGALLLILNIILQGGGFNSSIPIISLFIFAGYRLMPAFQQIYGAFTQLAFAGPALDKLYDDFENLKLDIKKNEENKISFRKKISLKNIYFSYTSAKKTTIQNVSLDIKSKSIIGLMGISGSGKTTILDIILGLLEPQKGQIEIDDKILTRDNIRSWQNLIGYVPQNIFLSDDSISANICFGLDSKNIDKNRIKKVSKIVSLHEFIINELPKQYDTIIGESGVRLSGGQRQRIGIARALYNHPKILVLDEATSALDDITEKNVMSGIHNLKQDLTIIIVAHRLNTLSTCDLIYEFDQGKLKGQGSYQQMVKNN